MEEIERRINIRVNSLNLLEITVTEDEIIVNQGMGRTLNVSESGILLENHFLIPPRNSLTLAVTIGNDLIYLKGVSIHSKSVNNKTFATGIQFVDTDQPALQVIRKLIDVFKRQTAKSSP
jgi:hypothetical protein